jgi:hydroxymethylpyrimidine pyrophosphatase-like HAD family hydrolase
LAADIALLCGGQVVPCYYLCMFEKLPTKELPKDTDRIYVFDLDGVVTDPQTNKVSAEVLAHVIDDLKQGRAAAFNTGRPHEWVTEHVLPGLREACSPDELENLLLVAEMGGVVCTFKDGDMHIELDETLSLPGAFIDGVLHLLDVQQPDGSRLADSMTWDSHKKTMGSLVKWDHTTLDEYNQVRPVLTKGLEHLLQTHDLGDFIIGQTTIATDIQHRTAGKHKGADQVLDWLHDRGVTPRNFYTFGDSISDKAMAETFAATGAKTTFVFVGDPAQGSEVQGQDYETVIMEGRHSSDTADYLAKLA